MAASALPTAVELAGLNDLAAVVRFTGLEPVTWRQVNLALGNWPNLRLLSQAPPDGIAEALATMQLPRLGGDGNPVDPPEMRELTMVETVQIALIWRIARQTYGMEDIDILAPGALNAINAVGPATATGANLTPLPVGAGVTAKALGIQKIKVSQIADQLDDTESEVISKIDVDEAYRTYRDIMGADPPTEAEPSIEQLTVMINKVVTRGSAPYADFSVLTPYARRTQKHMKAKGFMLQEDGSWKQSEVPGPPSFEAWSSCWDVYRTILLMMKHDPVHPGGDRKAVMTWAALDEYCRNIANLNRQYPECWHLLMQAEDRCRSDHLERTRRNLTRAAAEGRLPMNLSFAADQPWIGVFTYVARDQAYWSQEVQIPAQNFIARGGGGRRMSKMDAELSDISEAAKDAMGGKLKGSDKPHGEGESKAAKKRRRDKEKREEDWKKYQQMQDIQSWHKSNYESSSWRGPGGGKSFEKGKMQHPRKYGQFFVTDRDGDQICYKFAKGQPGACSEPCADQRAHVCQVCLGQHPNVQCQKKSTKKGDGKGK